MDSSNQGPDPEKPVREIGEQIYYLIANSYPVCAASDEFHYFPQALASWRGLNQWDDFSPASISRLTHKLRGLSQELAMLEDLTEDSQTRADILLLKRIANTLCEQFEEAEFWKSQPTFYLTVLSIGLAEALESEDRVNDFEERLKGAPAFLVQALDNLEDVPGLHCDLGLEMTADVIAWLKSLEHDRPGVAPVMSALESFQARLSTIKVCREFGVPRELLEKIVESHIGCEASIEEVKKELDDEIFEMERVMEGEAARLAPGRTWQEVMDSIALPPMPDGGLIELYRARIRELGNHCFDLGLVTEEEYRENPVKVEPIPSYLSAIRSAAAYSMPPGHPPGGGVFYLIDVDIPAELMTALHRDCRMLTAHETYPGHHLLDLCRWNNARPLRRPAEFPLFYEGWACFAEEMLVHTGHFSEPTDRLQLARRHYWRALRGKIDLALQTGDLGLDAAAESLVRAGMDRKRAAAVVKRYTLKPGYQLCYTIGLRRFRALFERYGRENITGFARRILEAGEIDFNSLALLLESGQ